MATHMIFRIYDSNPPERRHENSASPSAVHLLTPHPTLQKEKQLGTVDEKPYFFHLPLRTPFTIFSEDRRRLGIVIDENFVFSPASALAFHYLFRRQEAARHSLW